MAYKKPVADIIQDVYDEINNRIKTDAQLVSGDIEIGAVELKDATSDNRSVVDTQGRLHVYDEAGGSASVASQLLTDSITPGTSAAQITSTSTPLTVRITFRADSYNTGKVYIGDSSKQAQVLEAGEFIDVFIDDLSKIYLKSDNGTEVVTYSTG